MPIGTYLFLQTIIGMCIPGAVVVLANLATPGGPGPQDAWSVLGAMIASVIVIHKEARGGKLFLWKSPTLSSFLASAAIGSVGPGFVIYSILPFFSKGMAEEASAHITWHGWAASGLVLGLSGWGIVRGIMAIVNKIPRRMEAYEERRFGHLDRVPEERKNPDWIDPQQ